MMLQFSIGELMDAMQTAADQYLVFDAGIPTQESVERAWEKVTGICRVERLSKSQPYLKDLYYIRGILRRRIYVNERYIMELLEAAVTAGADVDSLKRLASSCRNWNQFRESVEAFIQKAGQQSESGRAKNGVP